QSHPCPAAAGMPGTQRGREHLAVSAPDLSRQPCVRGLHRHSRRLPGRLAKTSRRDRSHHLNRTTRLDHHRSISLKAGIIPYLQAAGLKVTAVQNPLTSLEDSVAATRRALALQDGPTVLVAHSWGGTVI